MVNYGALCWLRQCQIRCARLLNVLKQITISVLLCIAHVLSLLLLCIAHPVPEVSSQIILAPDTHLSVAVKHAAALSEIIQSQLLSICILILIRPGPGITPLRLHPFQRSGDVEVGRGHHRGKLVREADDRLYAVRLGPEIRPMILI